MELTCVVVHVIQVREGTASGRDQPFECGCLLCVPVPLLLDDAGVVPYVFERLQPVILSVSHEELHMTVEQQG